MMLLLDQGLPRSTVVHLAAHGVAAEHVIECVLTQAGAEIAVGAVISVTPARIRVRLLPIGRI